LNTSLMIFGYFQFLDLLTTVIFIMNGIQEANPLVKFALHATPYPVIGLVLVKIVALALAAYCWRLGRHSLLSRVNVLFALLISWNLLALLVRAAHLS